MPSFQMHLAVAKLYVQKNKGEITNEVDFFNGSVAPDLTDNKRKTHYSLDYVGDDLLSNLKNKIDLTQFFKLPLDNDFEKGVFLHLLTDYIFYNYYFPPEFLESTNYKDYTTNLYTGYDYTTDWLEKKYGTAKLPTTFHKQMKQSIIDLQTKRPEILLKGKNILADTDKLERFIDFVASLNLKNVKETQSFGVVNF
ncbi:MAG: hypothetical protein LBQ05_03080 [Christensenellaceae bacterium]|jgi:hypothetical protein|nr:hypothetical protein [Christensenellaceae bacterium]